MAIQKYTFFFEQNGYGWTESWLYNSFTSPAPSQAQQLIKFGQYRNIRTKMLASTAKMTFFRSSTLTSPTQQGQRQSWVYPANGNNGSVPGTNESGDPSFSAVLVACYDFTFLHRKNWFCRGIPDADDVSGGSMLLDGDFAKALGQLATFLYQNNWGWNTSTQLNTYPLATVSQNAAGWVDFTTLNSPVTMGGPFVGLQQGYRLSVRFQGVNGATQLNGQTTVIVGANANSGRTEELLAILPWAAGSGALKLPVKAVFPVYEFDPLRIVSRRPGRPSYQSRGKRSANRTGR